MKRVTTKFIAWVAIVVEVKKRTDLLIIRITNLKTFATVEALIIGMAN
jgi:hypothetical protein